MGDLITSHMQKQQVSKRCLGDLITSHMQKIIQIHPCLLKLSRKQESVTDGQPLLLYPSLLSRGIITSHMQEIIQIYPCLLKLLNLLSL